MPSLDNFTLECYWCRCQYIQETSHSFKMGLSSSQSCPESPHSIAEGTAAGPWDSHRLQSGQHIWKWFQNFILLSDSRHIVSIDKLQVQ